MMVAWTITVATARSLRMGVSSSSTGYARTRLFSERYGFLALEETELWGENTPCRIMVKPLITAGTAAASGD